MGSWSPFSLLESLSGTCVKNGLGVDRNVGRTAGKLSQGLRLGTFVAWTVVVALEMGRCGSVEVGSTL